MSHPRLPYRPPLTDTLPTPPDAPETPRALPTVHTLDEAAAILRVRKSWLERQAAARKIPFTMLGGAYHFTVDHLTAIVRIYEAVPQGREEPRPTPQPVRRPSRPLPPSTVAPLRPRPVPAPRRAA